MAGTSDFFWDDLLEYIDVGSVVPIIGPDLLRTKIDGRDVRIEELIARRLAKRLGVDTEFEDSENPINRVVCRHIERDRGNTRAEIYPRLCAVMKELELEPPEPLKQLASVRNFSTIVTTTFD